MSPVDWWHNLEGGKIADARPPPPNADAPYPNLGSVPPKPPPPDTKGLGRIAGALVADRANAQYAAMSQPIPAVLPAAPPLPVATPPTAEGGDDEPASAALPAATAPPLPHPVAPQPVPPSPPPRPAPVAAVSATPLAPVASTQAPAPAPTGSMPEPAAAPPPPPSLPGVTIPTATAPTPPPVAPPAPPPAPLPPGPPLAIAFPKGSAVLPPWVTPELRKLAAGRGARSIAVTGFGEAQSADPAAESAALPLGLNRARAVAAALRMAGVPDAALRIAAEPQGFGASARLVN